MSPVPSEPEACPFVLMQEGVRVRIKVTPRASAERIGTVVDGGYGEPALSVAVTAAPTDGKANIAVVRALARAWRLPKSAFSITSGESDRRKTITIAGDGPRLLATLEAWLQQHHDLSVK